MGPTFTVTWLDAAGKPVAGSRLEFRASRISRPYLLAALKECEYLLETEMHVSAVSCHIVMEPEIETAQVIPLRPRK